MWELIRTNKRKSTILIFLLAFIPMGLGYAIGFSIQPQGAEFLVLQ